MTELIAETISKCRKIWDYCSSVIVISNDRWHLSFLHPSWAHRLVTNLLDPKTEVKDAVRGIALPIRPAHLPYELRQALIQLLRTQGQKISFHPGCMRWHHTTAAIGKHVQKHADTYCLFLQVVKYLSNWVGILPGLEPSSSLASSVFSEEDNAQRFQAWTP